MDHLHEYEVACGDGGSAAGGREQPDLTIDLDGEQLIFSDDHFPLLPDFPCINLPPASPMPTSVGNPCFSSSSPSSWVFNSATSSGSAIVPTPSEERDVIDILNEIYIRDPAFDPSLFFSDESVMVEPVSETQTSGEGDVFGGSNGNSLNCLFGRDGSSEELADIFLEWLKSNKDSICREDLRNIKIKKSIIDSALRGFGSDKQGRAKLFKLILTWVQNHHLQKKHCLQHHHQNAFPAFSSPYQNHNQHFPFSPVPFSPVPIIPCNSPNMDYNDEAEHNITGCNTWSPYFDPSMMMNYAGGAMPYQFPGSSFVGCPRGWTGPPNFGVAAPPSPYLFPAPSAPITPAHYPVGFTAVQQMYPGQPFVASVPAPAPAPDSISATREARKKRAQLRRYSVRSHNHNNISKSQRQVHHHQLQKNHISRIAAAQETRKTSTLRSKQIEMQAVPPAPTPTRPLPQESSLAPTPLLPIVSSLAPPLPQVSSPATPQPQGFSPLRQQLSLQNGARHQGLKGDKKMTLLFQKMLKQSDVNGLGRIVLPKKEAELHLPALEGRDGISLVMEDIGTSRVWSMRYRFWPNNKSRMYLLENTAEFIRLNGLQEGDFIVIYLDANCNKYLIKGIKIQKSATQRAANRKSADLEKAGAAKNRIFGSPTAQRYTVIDSDYDDDDDDCDTSMLEAI